MKRVLFLMMIVLTFTSYSEGEVEVKYDDYSYKPPVIKSGEGEAKKSVGTTFIYEEFDQYKIYSRVGYVTTIQLKEGEVLEDIVYGDTTRWLVHPSPTGKRTTVYIKPVYDKITTNLVLKTNEREYQFYLVATEEWHNPIVRFRYPRAEQMVKHYELEKKREEEKNYTKVDLNNLYFDYDISKSRYDFAPSQIYDDGEKTVLVMKEKLQETPVVFIIDDQTKEELLVNFRFVNNRMIIDRLFNKAILKLGKKCVKIERESKYQERIDTSSIAKGGS